MRTVLLARRGRGQCDATSLRFNPAAIEDPHQLKVGAEVTAHAVFDGKQYKAANLRIEKTNPQDENKGQAKVQ